MYEDLKIDLQHSQKSAQTFLAKVDLSTHLENHSPDATGAVILAVARCVLRIGL